MLVRRRMFCHTQVCSGLESNTHDVQTIQLGGFIRSKIPLAFFQDVNLQEDRALLEVEFPNILRVIFANVHPRSFPLTPSSNNMKTLLSVEKSSPLLFTTLDNTDLEVEFLANKILLVFADAHPHAVLLSRQARTIRRL